MSHSNLKKNIASQKIKKKPQILKKHFIGSNTSLSKEKNSLTESPKPMATIKSNLIYVNNNYGV